jgi:hypothetical protein
MNRNRRITIAVFAVAIAGGLASIVVHSQATVAQEATVHATATDAAEAPTLDAKSALLSAIALGYTEIRGAGLVGDLYQVEAIDTTGGTVRLYMDPDTGVVIKIEKDM